MQETVQTTDQVYALREAARTGWQQLVLLNDWLKANSPKDYEDDNDTATAVINVLNRQMRQIGHLNRERSVLRRQMVSISRFANDLLAQKRRRTRGAQHAASINS